MDCWSCVRIELVHYGYLGCLNKRFDFNLLKTTKLFKPSYAQNVFSVSYRRGGILQNPV